MDAVQRPVRRDMILLALGTLALCGLFLGKAYHIDDTLVVWTAQRITAHPADFYGFEVNWFGFYAPMVQVYLNPPGAAYYAAAFGALFGWSEPVMHGSMALMAVALVLGVYWLARQLNGNPLPAAVLALVSPGVLVSMGTMMTDLPMTALWVWATALWLHGLDERQSNSKCSVGTVDRACRADEILRNQPGAFVAGLYASFRAEALATRRVVDSSCRFIGAA